MSHTNSRFSRSSNRGPVFGAVIGSICTLFGLAAVGVWVLEQGLEEEEAFQLAFQLNDLDNIDGTVPMIQIVEAGVAAKSVIDLPKPFGDLEIIEQPHGFMEGGVAITAISVRPGKTDLQEGYDNISVCDSVPEDPVMKNHAKLDYTRLGKMAQVNFRTATTNHFCRASLRHNAERFDFKCTCLPPEQVAAFKGALERPLLLLTEKEPPSISDVLEPQVVAP